LAAGTRPVPVEEPAAAARLRPPPRAVPWPVAPLLLVAAAAGLLGQGAYYGPVQRFLGLLVAAASLAAAVAWPPVRDDAHLLPLVPAAALAAWALADAALAGHPAAGAGVALELLGLVAVLFVCRRLSREDRDVLLTGLIGAGLLVAATGWLGVAARVGSLAWVGDGIWRASATLSYPNAAAAVLVPLALVVLDRLVTEPRSAPLAVAATGLLAGLAATLSRAGVLALVVGLAVLAGLAGPGRTARAAAGPCAGALLALAGLVPSFPAGAQPRPALALAGLAAGLALAVGLARVGRNRALSIGVVAVAGAGVLAGLAGGGGAALRRLAEARATLASPDRTDALRAAFRVVADHPVAGAGPGRTELRWEGPDGGTHFFTYVHNEYVQTAADLGLVGLVLLGILLVALARMLWRARAAGDAAWPWAGAVAATAAFAVHSGFDFVWHLPAVVLTVALLAGAVLPPPPAAAGSRPPSPPRKGAP
jgi:O-Antigen ligase